jgi:hypothetical protein
LTDDSLYPYPSSLIASIAILDTNVGPLLISAVHVTPIPVKSVYANSPTNAFEAGYPGYSAIENAGLIRTAVSSVLI